MALETLRDIKEIDNLKVVKAKNSDDYLSSIDLFDDGFIHVDHDLGMIGFLIQDGPVKEFGVNGCQVDTILKTCLIILEKLNYKAPCSENECAINHLERAIEYLQIQKIY